MQSAATRFWKDGLLFFIARALICLFFLDNCLAAFHNWQFYQTDFMKFRVKEYPHRYQDPGIVLPLATFSPDVCDLAPGLAFGCGWAPPYVIALTNCI